MQPDNIKNIFSYPKYWASCFDPAPFLPTTKQEMDILGWDSCDIIIISGDAYVDHPSFGAAIIGRALEASGFRVGIIDQPNWDNTDDFKKLGAPNLFFGVTAGNMDSMINHYTADKKPRSDDAYTPNNVANKRPDRAVMVYTNKCRESYPNIPIIIGGIEASLRRLAHYDYWQDKVRASILIDSKADILVYGNGERPIIEIAHRLANNEHIDTLDSIRGTAIIRSEPLPTWRGVDGREFNKKTAIAPKINPYANCTPEEKTDTYRIAPSWEKTYILLPSFAKVTKDKHAYAHTSRLFHQEMNPGCARALFQPHTSTNAIRGVWINPPAYPLTTDEMDQLFALPFARLPHPSYQDSQIPAFDMIKTSVNIMRGCFGGCSFCSITEHEGRIIQSRSQQSILDEIEAIKNTPKFSGYISDLGGPTANMYGQNCSSPRAAQTCRRLSCLFPSICKHLNTDHSATIDLYRAARAIPGIKKIFVASGVRYDLAIRSESYIKELVTHHVGGYLKIAPEHTETNPLSKMMKPNMDSYYKFKQLFNKFSKEAGAEQYLIPYFIAAHPGTSDQDMLNLALWLKKEKLKLDQVQNFYPSPLSNATAMYHSELNSLKNVDKDSEMVLTPKNANQRKLHKALLRYHDSANWDLIRKFLISIKRSDLIGRGSSALVPPVTLKKSFNPNR